MATLKRLDPQKPRARFYVAASDEISSATPAPPAKDGLGALRLLLASLVIVAHVPEQLDGDAAREPLTQIFGTITFGGLAVDGFFLISGFLISGSFMASRGVVSYFAKRILRIYPAFIVCSLICLLVVAPLARADLSAFRPQDWAMAAWRMLCLSKPEAPGAFDGLPYPTLNGAMWTIAYEFRCYVFAAIFGVVGLYKAPRLFLAATAILIAGSIVVQTPVGSPLVGLYYRLGLADLTGDPLAMVRFVTVFACGICFRLFNDRIVYRGWIAALCAAALVGLLFLPLLVHVAIATFGGYLLFWIAFRATWRPLRTINARDDISYGLYLWAWPVAMLLIWSWRDIPLITLGVATWVGAALLGAASWFLIEKPCLKLKPRRDPGQWTPAATAPSTRSL